MNSAASDVGETFAFFAECIPLECENDLFSAFSLPNICIGTTHVENTFSEVLETMRTLPSTAYRGRLPMRLCRGGT